MSRAEIVFELLDEIRRMECEVMYFQNQILRKRIAVQQIMNGAELQGDAQTEEELKPIRVIPLRDGKGRLTKGAWNQFLAERNGDEFGREEVAEFAKRIGFTGNIPLAITAKIHYWLSGGHIRRTGYRRWAKNKVSDIPELSILDPAVPVAKK